MVNKSRRKMLKLGLVATVAGLATSQQACGVGTVSNEAIK